MKVFALLMALLNALLTVFGMGGGIKNRYDTYLNVAYGDSPTALMDVYIPASAKGHENNGVLVFLHGGHWKSGTKSDMESDCTRYIDPQDGSVTRTMYSNNIPTICATVNPDGTAVWKGLTFPLIER